VIDLRSDTVTVPTEAMRKAIADAEVGDDVYHDDPTVNRLEERVAELLGKEDALYTPTGTMANQAALRTHTEPGDIVLASVRAHLDNHELGGPNAISGVTVRWLEGPGGTFTGNDVAAQVPTPGQPSWHSQPVTLVACENTHNASGGSVWPIELIDDVTTTAGMLGLARHLDGARLWNASVASGIEEARLARDFDTVSVCFSKGLGAPMGSALAGPADLIERARRFKQMLGGGFRQAGMMAAGALYAIDNHRERLAEDHANATRLASGLSETPGIALDTATVPTNMVYFDVLDGSAAELYDRLLRHGVAVDPKGKSTIRAVTHLGISARDVDTALGAVAAALDQS
jgi:threonine aldolase